MDLCTIEDLRGVEGQETMGFVDSLKGSTKYDTLFATLITAVSRRFESFCNRTFEYNSAITEYYSGNGERGYIYVKRPPIATVTSIHDDVDRDFDSTTLVDADYYVVFDDRVEMKYSAFTKGLKNIKIIYSGGYSTATLPADIRLAAMMQVAFVFKRRADLGLVGISGEGGSISVQSPMKLLPEVEATLQPYKLWTL